MRVNPELAAKILSTPGVLVDGKPVNEQGVRETLANVSEEDFLEAVLSLAQDLGWLRAHFRPCRTAKGWRTAVQGDGKGWPDLALAHVRQGRFLVAELKAEGGRLSPEQETWLKAFSAAGIPAYVWKPSDMPLIETILRGKDRCA